MRQMLESFINGTTYGYIKQQTIFHKLLTISCFKNYVYVKSWQNNLINLYELYLIVILFLTFFHFNPVH